jgi:vesicle-fusing ATPase
MKELIIKKLQEQISGLVLTKLYNDIKYEIIVDSEIVTVKIHDIIRSGFIAEHTSFHIKSSENVVIESALKIYTKEVPSREEIKKIEYIDEPFQPLSIDFSQLKIGGLKHQIKEISDVIRPRCIDQKHLDNIGFDSPEKGILLYGPSGTGKTLIARELSKVLGVKQFVIVNGPELLNKYVGESESNIRQVLSNYSKDLKVVFFDEFDSLGKRRAGDDVGSQTSNNIVNQILSIMDGTNQTNNILIIGATNRIDMIDQALLRPGRFGLCLYIGLPDKQARLEIFQIHLAKNIEQGTLSSNISMSISNKEHYHPIFLCHG